MDSYGEQLRIAREAKNLEFETVSRDTSITVQFLQGLEKEDNSVFPGEPYMLGFLRNYAEYLGLNGEDLLRLYRNKKLQETPVPEALLVQEKPSFFLPMTIGIVGIVLLFIIILLVILFSKNKPQDDSEIVLDKASSSRKYELKDNSLQARVYIGDQIIFPTDNGNILLTIADTLGSLGIQSPVGTLYTELSEESELDIDGDKKSDLIVYVSDISASDASRGAELRMVKRSNTELMSSVGVSDIPLASEIESKHKQVVIFEDTRAYPFTLNGSFRGSCVLRYKIDRHDATEQYFSSGEVVTMTANNGIRTWMSNCNTVKLSVIADSRSYDLEIGKAGQVLVQDIKWIKDTDGKYKLIVIELD